MQERLIFKSVLGSQFRYCPIVWMFCSMQNNDMINKLHERSFRILINDQTSNFKTLLTESSDVCNHHRNILTLLTEAYEIQNNLAPLIMETMLERKIILSNFWN